MKGNELQERLVKFSIRILKITDRIPTSRSGNILASQLGRSATSVSLNYSEAREAESLKDFIHKCKIVIKELRETLSCLEILEGVSIITENNNMNELKQENNELIAIFVSSIKTARSRFNS